MTRHLLEDMTADEFRAVPSRKPSDDIGPFDALVIVVAIDGAELHEAGYRIMSFVACRDGEPVCTLGRGDVLTLGDKLFPAVATWRMDCLPASGFVRIWNKDDSDKMYAGHGMTSSLEIFNEGQWTAYQGWRRAQERVCEEILGRPRTDEQLRAGRCEGCYGYVWCRCKEASNG